MIRLVISVGLLVLASGVACKGKKNSVPDRTYKVRGLVESVSASSKPREVLVKHEAIDDFVDRTGVVRGMDAMGMPLSVADSVDLSGIAKGDKIEMDLEVVFSRETPGLLTRIKKLPADTSLVFRDARPPTPASK